MKNSSLFTVSIILMLLIFTSCNDSEQSTDLQLISNNLDAATQSNNDAAGKIRGDMMMFLVVEENSLTKERISKLQNTIDKTSKIMAEASKILDLLGNQIKNIEIDTPVNKDKINSAAKIYFNTIYSNIGDNIETKETLKLVKSELDFSHYKFDGTKTEKLLALKSIQLSVSNSNRISVLYLRSTRSLESPSRVRFIQK